MPHKKVIAVIFGGRSVEHDVSILTGLQFIEALDPTKYTGLPVYVDPLGQWWTGEALKKRNHYPITKDKQKALTEIKLQLATNAYGQPTFLTTQKGLMGEKTKELHFDLMVPAIHGSNGEDGSLQGLLEFANIPYSGCRSLGSAATMNKVFAKAQARIDNINVLPELMLERPTKGAFLDPDNIQKQLEAAFETVSFPYIIKPNNLGSSVGVSKANDIDSLIGGLMNAFKMDSHVIIEPFVDNLEEFNIAVRRKLDGTISTSAIERPLRNADLLDFKNKYLGGSTPGAPKAKTGDSEGMASLNRELDPDDLGETRDAFIRESAAKTFDSLGLAGSVRIDFLSNAKTGDIWLNEVNTIPGSFAYFLWEAAADKTSFLKLADDMIEEGFALSKNRLGTTDTAGGGATIFVDQ